ncbi:AAA family ATPase [Ectobacillus ponti]|uniref:Nuclease SbcCD subunit C n=1 Tax=Ectobacillus ponti TaxID=2961894 RepID=A0AA42BQI8_9BACI|nr:SMC family ATPase [Ectobacillus ponti]MCP8970345.1 SMC family ATPase [Ectobacillus ponti]
MRPIQLTITAFGPYKHQEMIDFTELGEHRLFSISGNTGAGKTTIFDALCYALYGEASGEERSDPGMLRSHFAEDDVPTSVELTFAIKGHSYHVMRQMAHKKKGNKTATGGSVALYEVVDGERIPCVDRFHVTDVNQKIEQVIGLNKNQFSQIVMLPQGEFRRLLTSETENKEEILRRIFKTDRYKLMKEALDRKRKAQQGYIDQKRNERAIHFRSALKLPDRPDAILTRLREQEHINGYQMLEALDEELQFYKSETVRLEQQDEMYGDMLQQKQEAYHHAKHINERFAELAQKEQAYEELLAKQEEMKREEARLQMANAAALLQSFEQAYLQAVQTAGQAEQEQLSLAARNGQVQQQFQTASIRYEAEKEREQEREDSKELLRVLEDLRPVLKTFAERERQMRAAQLHLEQVQQQLQASEDEQEACLRQRKELSQSLLTQESALQGLVEKNEELLAMRGDAAIFRDYFKAVKAEEEERAALAAAQQNLEQEERKHEAVLQSWLSGQAAQLAAHLADGAPCPVCGSHEHPHKAASHQQISKQQLEEAQHAKNAAYLRFSEAQGRWHANKEQAAQRLQELCEREYDVSRVEEVYQAFVQRGKQLHAEVSQLGGLKQQHAGEKLRLQELEARLEQSMLRKAALERQHRGLQSAFTEQRLAYEESKRKIPAELGTLEAWQARYAKATAARNALEQAWASAQAEYQHLIGEQAAIAAAWEAAKQQQEKAHAARCEQEACFQEKLEEAAFAGRDSYEAAKLPAAVCRQIEESLRAYHAALGATGQQIADIRAGLSGKQWRDLSSLQEELVVLEQRVKHMQDQLHRIRLLNDGIVGLYQEIFAIEEEIRDKEAEFQELAELYEVIKGDNESRISFERYILIEYLEQIVQAANERLRRLSNGQFSLKRSDRVEKRNRQSGLGLDVYDSYTGQTRDVKTLSGGEKFNASLCLALGMADVIQAFEGGISIETMFIDEGFGSLDEESLTKAIDALIDLQKSGRLIGVISHVQELKQALPAVLEVVKQKDGSSRTKFIVQQ